MDRRKNFNTEVLFRASCNQGNYIFIEFLSFLGKNNDLGEWAHFVISSVCDLIVPQYFLLFTFFILYPLTSRTRKSFGPASCFQTCYETNPRGLSATERNRREEFDSNLLSYTSLLSEVYFVTAGQISFKKGTLEATASDPRNLHNIFHYFLPLNPLLNRWWLCHLL